MIPDLNVNKQRNSTTLRRHIFTEIVYLKQRQEYVLSLVFKKLNLCPVMPASRAVNPLATSHTVENFSSICLHSLDQTSFPNRTVKTFFVATHLFRGIILNLGKVSGEAPPILWNFPNGTMWEVYRLFRVFLRLQKTCTQARVSFRIYCDRDGDIHVSLKWWQAPRRRGHHSRSQRGHPGTRAPHPPETPETPATPTPAPGPERRERRQGHEAAFHNEQRRLGRME